MGIKITCDIGREEIQEAFMTAFPYLRLSFFPSAIPETNVKNSIELSGEMTVAQVEDIFSRVFGLQAQILRKTGKAWVETNNTKNLTLNRQNEHGEELTGVIQKIKAKEEGI